MIPDKCYSYDPIENTCLINTIFSIEEIKWFDNSRICWGQLGQALLRLNATSLTGEIIGFDRNTLNPFGINWSNIVAGGQFNVFNGDSTFHRSRMVLSGGGPVSRRGQARRCVSIGSCITYNGPTIIGSVPLNHGWQMNGFYSENIGAYFVPGDSSIGVANTGLIGLRVLNTNTMATHYEYTDPILVSQECFSLIYPENIMISGDVLGNINVFNVSDPFVNITVIDRILSNDTDDRCVHLKQHPDDKYVHYMITALGKSYSFRINPVSYEIEELIGIDALMPSYTQGIKFPYRYVNPSDFGSKIMISGWNNQVLTVDTDDVRTYTSCLAQNLTHPMKIPGYAPFTDISFDVWRRPRSIWPQYIATQVTIDKNSFPTWPRNVLLSIHYHGWGAGTFNPPIAAISYCGSGQKEPDYPIAINTYNSSCDFDPNGEPTCCDLDHCLFLPDLFCCRNETSCSDDSICTYGNRTCPEPNLFPNGTICTSVGLCTETPGTCNGPVCTNATYFPPTHVCFNSTFDCQENGKCVFGNETCESPPISPDGTPCGDAFPDYSCLLSQECVGGICEGGIPKSKGDDCSVDGETCMITECDGEGVCEVLDDSDCPQNILPSQRNVNLPNLHPQISNHNDGQWIAIVVVVSSLSSVGVFFYLFFIAGKRKKENENKK